MSEKHDSFSLFDSLLRQVDPKSPWVRSSASEVGYQANFDLLQELVRLAVESSLKLSGGVLANAVDSWLAAEFRAAGFEDDEVWPRPERPRVLTKDLARLVNQSPKGLREELRARILQMPSVAPSDARFLGRAYEKQVDVAISSWARGPELMLSTKTQTSSFGKNLSNRFEEAYGDAGNLRGRYPLAATGFFFVQRASILRTEPEAFERTVDMVRKLRDRGRGDGYTATGLVLLDWEDGGCGWNVDVYPEAVPDDLHAGQFIQKLVESILEVTPVSYHLEARRRYEGRAIPVQAAD